MAMRHVKLKSFTGIPWLYVGSKNAIRLICGQQLDTFRNTRFHLNARLIHKDGAMLTSDISSLITDVTRYWLDIFHVESRITCLHDVSLVAVHMSF